MFNFELWSIQRALRTGEQLEKKRNNRWQLFFFCRRRTEKIPNCSRRVATLPPAETTSARDGRDRCTCDNFLRPDNDPHNASNLKKKRKRVKKREKKTSMCRPRCLSLSLCPFLPIPLARQNYFSSVNVSFSFHNFGVPLSIAISSVCSRFQHVLSRSVVIFR